MLQVFYLKQDTFYFIQSLGTNSTTKYTQHILSNYIFKTKNYYSEEETKCNFSSVIENRGMVFEIKQDVDVNALVQCNLMR